MPMRTPIMLPMAPAKIAEPMKPATAGIAASGIA